MQTSLKKLALTGSVAALLLAMPVSIDLGRSGATGLDGGDHLHFAVLVGDTYVDTVEWWDAKWIKDHVLDRMNQTN